MTAAKDPQKKSGKNKFWQSIRCQGGQLWRNTFNRQEIKKRFKTLSFRIGCYSTFITLAVIAILVVLNLLFSLLPTSATNIDLSTNQLAELSEQSIATVSSLEEEVVVYWIVESGNEDTTLSRLLTHYRDLSAKISVVKKDPVVYPGFTQQYTSETVADNSLIVTCGSRSKFIAYSNIYETDYSNYSTTGTYDAVFDGEGEITSAINYVTSDALPKAYLLTGHGETSWEESVGDAIAKENIQTESLNLFSQGSVPQDAACLIIFSPQADLSAEETTVILDYLEGGGGLLLLTDCIDSALPNLAALMENFGVQQEKGLVIEGSSAHCLYNYNYYLLPEIASHEITDSIITGGYYALMPLCQGINLLDNYRSSLEITQLLTTTDQSYAKADFTAMTTTDKEDGDSDGPFALGVAVSENNDENETRVVWFATSQFLASKINEMVAGANLDLFTNALGWACNYESAIAIHAKTIAVEYLTLSSAASARWSLVFVGLLPLIFLGTGFYVWYKRKHS